MPPRFILITVACLLLLQGLASGQDSAGNPAVAATGPAPEASAAARTNLTVEELQARLAKVAEDASLDDVTRGTLTKRYQEAIEFLNQATKYRDTEAGYRRALDDGPEQVKAAQQETAKLQAQRGEPALPPGLDHRTSDDRIQAALLEAQTDLATLKNQLADVLENLAELQSKDGQSVDEIAAAQEALQQVESELDAGPEPTADGANRFTEAERANMEARWAMLSAKVNMLQQGTLSREIRQSMAEAERSLKEVQIARTEMSVAAIQSLATSILERDLSDAETLLDRLENRKPELPPALQTRLEQLSGLIDKTRTLAASFAGTEALLAKRETERKRIAQSLDDTRALLELGGVEHNLAQMLLEELRSIPSKRESRQRLSQIEADSTVVQSSLFELARMMRTEPPGEATDKPAVAREDAAALDKAREKLISNLRSSYRRNLRDLTDLERVERAIQSSSAEFLDFALEKLFWVRSSPVINADAFTTLGEGMAYCYGPARWGELVSRLSSPPRTALICLVVVVAMLLALRGRCDHWLAEAAAGTRRISTDRFAHTGKAIMATALLAAPVPLTIFAMGWILFSQPDASAWSFGLGASLLSSYRVLPALFFLLLACRKSGLFKAHFGWREALLNKIGKTCVAVIVLHLITKTTLALVTLDPTTSHVNGFGRIVAIAGVFALMGIAIFLLHPQMGIAALIYERSPGSLFGRLRSFWLILILSIGLALVTMLVVGYVYAGILLLVLMLSSTAAIAVAVIAYGLLLRWFAIHERRIAHAAAVKELAARRERVRMAKQAGGDGEATATSEIPIEAESEIDLAVVGEQTRRLLGFLVGMGLLAQLFFDWTQFGPIVGVLGNFEVLGDFSIADIASAILIVAVTASATANLPGLMELLVLRRTKLDRGTRSSIITLGKYLVIAIGSAFLFHAIGVDWSQFGWIAAALGVGIGFGLQEVVANFISGIILLFERPVRVGDVVTVDGIDGRVSKIQIRATTITNWDHKEFVVPNKNFITGTVLNWTLSNPVNRLLIVVGVAYGSDTEKACRILVDVASDHPRTTDDPAPVATFEEFSDSSLKLVLRCFLPNMDNRIQVISDLHTEIAKRLEEADIEIPFPQRDLHLRSAEACLRLAKGSASTPPDSSRPS